MLEQHNSPVPEPSGLQNSVHYREENDIELPASEDTSQSDSMRSTQVSGKLAAWGKLLGAAVLTAFIAVVSLGLLPGGSDESQHPNWQHVSAATRVSTEGMSQLVHVSPGEMTRTQDFVEFTSADANRAATWQIRKALMRNDLATATSILQRAQRIPAAPEIDIQPPDLSANGELVSALQKGRKELFQIELFDCCQEDGDVVEVLVNGSHFSTVPITNAGTLLSIPLSSGSNTITILGTRDGRGGVTLSLRTSRGEFFARRMNVGEAYQMGVVVQ